MAEERRVSPALALQYLPWLLTASQEAALAVLKVSHDNTLSCDPSLSTSVHYYSHLSSVPEHNPLQYRTCRGC
jgi:hypothetical protein